MVVRSLNTETTVGVRLTKKDVLHCSLLKFKLQKYNEVKEGHFFQLASNKAMRLQPTLCSFVITDSLMKDVFTDEQKIKSMKLQLLLCCNQASSSQQYLGIVNHQHNCMLKHSRFTRQHSKRCGQVAS